MISKNTGLALLICLTGLLILCGLSIDRIPQPDIYHHFADQNTWFGIPNTLDVLSNIFFAIGGVWGLSILKSPSHVQFVDKRERWIWIGFSVGLILTAIGSAYYHWAPSNATLVWDRLSMVIVFMSLAAALICERFSVYMGLKLWPLLLAFGFYSVKQWYISETLGEGDLRLYLGVQIFTIITVFVALITPSPYTRKRDLGFVILFFVMARLFEIYDHEIYGFDFGILSGHTLKHLAAAMAGIWLIRMIKMRKVISVQE